MNSKFGVAIGIPVNFHYKNLADLEADDIQVIISFCKAFNSFMQHQFNLACAVIPWPY